MRDTVEINGRTYGKLICRHCGAVSHVHPMAEPHTHWLCTRRPDGSFCYVLNQIPKEFWTTAKREAA